MNRRTHDLLVFLDATNKAVLSTPLGVWRPEDVDIVTETLGIQPAARKFVNSAAELESVVHAVPLPPTFAAQRGRRWPVVMAIYVLVILLVIFVLVLQRSAT